MAASASSRCGGHGAASSKPTPRSTPPSGWWGPRSVRAASTGRPTPSPPPLSSSTTAGASSAPGSARKPRWRRHSGTATESSACSPSRSRNVANSPITSAPSPRPSPTRPRSRWRTPGSTRRRSVSADRLRPSPAPRGPWAACTTSPRRGRRAARGRATASPTPFSPGGAGRGPAAPLAVIAASPGPAALSPPVVLTPDLGLAGRAVRQGRVCWSADVLADPDIRIPESRRRAWAGAGMQTALAAPLRGRGRIVGVLSLGFPKERELPEDERVLAEAFAGQAALPLENARLYEEADRRRHEAEVLAGIARTMNASLEVDAILQRVAEGARALCGSDIARIALRDPDSGAHVFRYWVNTRYSGYEAAQLYAGTASLGGLVLMTRRPHRTDDWMADPRFTKETAHVVLAEGIITQMIVPIRIADEIE